MKTTHVVLTAQQFEVLFQNVCNWGVWGADDERGTLNYMTPECVQKAAALVRSGRSVSMAVPINKVAGPDNPHPVAHYMAQVFDGSSALGEPGFSLDYLAGEIHGDPLPPAGAIDRLAMHLKAAHAKHIIAGQAAQLLADFDRAAERGSRDHDALSLEYEGTVDGQGDAGLGRPGGRAGRRLPVPLRPRGPRPDGPDGGPAVGS